MKNTDEQYMELALEEAKQALKENSWPIGCVVVLNGKVIAKAHNCKAVTGDRLDHAEITAINSVIKQLDEHVHEATLYTTYEPCILCLGAIVIARISRVVCGIDLNESGCLGVLEALPTFWKQDMYKVEYSRGVLAEECEAVFRQFKKQT